MDLDYYAKQNNSVGERQMPYFTHMWNVRSKTNEQRERDKQKNHILT